MEGAVVDVCDGCVVHVFLTVAMVVHVGGGCVVVVVTVAMVVQINWSGSLSGQD